MNCLATISLLSILPSSLFGQNLINNPSFEFGTTPPSMISQSQNFVYATNWTNGCGRFKVCTTGGSNPGNPFLFDRMSPDCRNDVPANAWTPNLDEHTGQNRYVQIGGSLIGWHCDPDDGIPYYQATVEGTLTEALASTCEYRVSFYAAAPQGPSLTPPCSNIGYMTPDPIYNKMQVVLRKDNDCSIEKVVYTSSSITSMSWTHYQGDFTLTAAEAAVGYNRIEFRRTPTPHLPKGSPNPYSSSIFLDDVSLIPGRTQPINSDFTLTATNPTGSVSDYIVTATVSSIPSGSGFYWEVCEVDLSTGNDIGGTCMSNPSNWWDGSLWYTNTFPGYCCNPSLITGNGTFLLGHKYRVKRGTWAECSPWSQTIKTVFMDTHPGLSVVEDEGTQLFSEDPRKEIGNSTSISQNERVGFDMRLRLSPNPTNGKVNVWLDEISAHFPVELNIYAQSGQLLSTQQLNEDVSQVDIGKYPAGIYLIRVCDEVFSITKAVSLQK